MLASQEGLCCVELHVYLTDKFLLLWDSEVITDALSESFDLHFLLSTLSLKKYPPHPHPHPKHCAANVSQKLILRRVVCVFRNRVDVTNTCDPLGFTVFEMHSL
jgi:hypothetical protein